MCIVELLVVNQILKNINICLHSCCILSISIVRHFFREWYKWVSVVVVVTWNIWEAEGVGGEGFKILKFISTWHYS